MADLRTSLYGLSLFVHILGVVALFGGFVLAQRGVLLDQARKMIPSGGGMLLVSGVALMALGGWRLDAAPWIGVAMLGLLALVPLAMVGLREPPRPLLRGIANGLALTNVWLMTVKPGLVGAVVALAVGLAGGAALGLRTRPASPQAERSRS